MIENEFKLMLTEAQYEAVHAAFAWDREIVQTNHYYDTPALTLSEGHVTCRVRELEGKFLLQMKLPTDKAYSRVELEREIEGLPDALDGKTLREMSGRDDLPDVERLGKLLTARSVKRYGELAEIDLDRSEYFGRIDYELEIEFTDEKKARELLDEVTALIGEKPASEVCTGKIHRFLEEYKKTR